MQGQKPLWDCILSNMTIFIFSPVIKYDILHAQPKDDNYIAVYLSHYADEMVAAQLHRVKNMRFKLFSKK